MGESGRRLISILLFQFFLTCFAWMYVLYWLYQGQPHQDDAYFAVETLIFALIQACVSIYVLIRGNNYHAIFSVIALTLFPSYFLSLVYLTWMGIRLFVYWLQ